MIVWCYYWCDTSVCMESGYQADFLLCLSLSSVYSALISLHSRTHMSRATACDSRIRAYKSQTSAPSYDAEQSFIRFKAKLCWPMESSGQEIVQCGFCWADFVEEHSPCLWHLADQECLAVITVSCLSARMTSFTPSHARAQGPWSSLFPDECTGNLETCTVNDEARYC